MHHRACELRRRLPVVTESSDSQLCTSISATPGLLPVRLLTSVSQMCKRSVPNSISLVSHCYHERLSDVQRSVQIHVSCDSCLSYVQRSVQLHVSCQSCLSLICEKISAKIPCLLPVIFLKINMQRNVITRVSVSDDSVQQLEQPAVSQLVLLSATHWPCLCY